jgi:hypothetical protein
VDSHQHLKPPISFLLIIDVQATTVAVQMLTRLVNQFQSHLFLLRLYVRRSN